MSKVYIIILIGLMFTMQLNINIKLTQIEKQLQELKELKMTMETVESQIKLLTPPPDFFELPVVKR